MADGGVDFGQSAASNAGQIGLGLQTQTLDRQKLNADAINQGNQRLQQSLDVGTLPQQQALGQEQQKINQNAPIKITKELAEGIGDPKLEGLIMDPRMLGILSKVSGARDYHDQLISDKDKRDELDRQAKQKLQDSEDLAKSGREDKALKAKSAAQDKTLKAKQSGSKGGSKAPTELPNDKAFKTRFKQNETALSGVNGTMLQSSNPKEYADRQAYKQKYQKDYDEQTSPSKEQNAVQWLKKNHPELKNPTDADIQWAQENMGG